MTHPPTNPLSRTRRRRVRRCRGLLEGGKVKEIHTLRKENKSIRSIAETLGISRNTVRKYLRTPGLPEPQPRPPRSSKLDPYREYIKRRMLQDGVTNSHVLLRELRAMGSTGGRTILKDFMKPLRPPQPAPAALRFETGPGEQAQVDLTPITLVRPDGTTQQVWAFAMVLDWSRAGDVEVIAKADLPSFQRCHVHAFEHFGGVPRRLLYDNTKLVVLGRDPNGPPMWTPRFLDCALRMGFDPRLCQPYRAQTKGKVEHFLRYVQDTFVPSARPPDLDDLHRQAVLWCLHVADQRIHGTTHERPADRLKQERLLLRPMPPAERIAPFLRESRKGGRDGFVIWQGSASGVPWTYAGQEVQIQATEERVEIWAGSQRIAVHPRAHAPGQRFVWPGQWDGLPSQTPPRRRAPVIVQGPDGGVEVRPLSVYEALVGGVDGHGRP
jgi:transposase